MLLAARALERGWLAHLLPRAVARPWESRVTLARPLDVPKGKRVITVGGATLGGSHKTPVAIALARSLAPFVRVAFVGHAYRAKPQRARIVTEGDSVREVGDEALLAAHELGEIPVVVAPSRESAVRLAAEKADVIILDGPLQLSPRATLSILAVDARAPWGSGMCPPLGDLRAPRTKLDRAADLVVRVRDELEPGSMQDTTFACDVTGSSWAALAQARVGVVASIARPERFLRALAVRGVRPHRTVWARDHEPINLHQRGVDVWLTVRKSAAFVREALVVEQRVALSPSCANQALLSCTP